MSTSGTKKPISVGMADFFTCSMKPPSERLTTSIVMMNVPTGAAKENRTTDSVVVPNSDVTLDQDAPRILTKCGHIPGIVAESGMSATYIIALAGGCAFLAHMSEPRGCLRPFRLLAFVPRREDRLELELCGHFAGSQNCRGS